MIENNEELTLRDRFALEAMNALIVNTENLSALAIHDSQGVEGVARIAHDPKSLSNPALKEELKRRTQLIAILAYQFADAMREVRLGSFK